MAGSNKHKKMEWKHREGADDISIKTLDVPYYSIIHKEKELRKAVKKKLCQRKYDLAIAYLIHQPYMSAVAYAKKIQPDIKTVLICPDLPDMMDLAMHKKKIKAFLKALDKHRIEYLYKKMDGFVLFAEAMKERIPIDHAKYIVVEGCAAIDELDAQMKQVAAGEPTEPKAFAHQIVANVIPQIGGPKQEMPGFTTEEAKLTYESRKILGAPDLKIACTCVRVPVFYAHSIAVHATFERPFTVEEMRDIFEKAPGVELVDDLATASYPMPKDFGGKDNVGIGRIRLDPSAENGIALWCSGDNIRKGAALNAVQIAEELVKRNLV
jgi:hypothetical protein